MQKIQSSSQGVWKRRPSFSVKLYKKSTKSILKMAGLPRRIVKVSSAACAQKVKFIIWNLLEFFLGNSKINARTGPRHFSSTRWTECEIFSCCSCWWVYLIERLFPQILWSHCHIFDQVQRDPLSKVVCSSWSYSCLKIIQCLLQKWGLSQKSTIQISISWEEFAWTF